jgi:hypothetical protein
VLNSNEIIVLQRQQDALRKARQQKLVQEALSGRTKISLFQRIELWLATAPYRPVASPLSTSEIRELNLKTHRAG